MIVAIRGEPGASRTVQMAGEMGFEIASFPLAEVRPVSWRMPDPADFDALLVGSANVFGHTSWTEVFRDVPVHAVGEATADAARAHGLTVAYCGTGGLQAVLDHHQGQKIRYLRLAGADRVRLEPFRGMVIDTRTVYEIVHLPMPGALADLLGQGGAVVLLHSASAATHFRAECERLGVALSGVRLATLGGRISAAAGDGWQAVQHPSRIAPGALLALAADMCH